MPERAAATRAGAPCVNNAIAGSPLVTIQLGADGPHRCTGPVGAANPPRNGAER